MQGTPGNDRIGGSDKNDTLERLLGNDTLLGSLGEDVLDAGEEFDIANYDVGRVGQITLEAAEVDVIDLPSDIDTNSLGLELSGNNIIFDEEILATVNISTASLTDADFV